MMHKGKWFIILAIVLIGIGLIFALKAFKETKKEKISLVTPWGVFTGKEVPGEDLACIGRYDDMIRGAYKKDQVGKGLVINLVYYKKGDIYKNVKSYFTSQMEKCGYKKESESEGPLSMPKFEITRRYTASYKKSKERILLTIGVLKSKNSEKYTLVVMNYSRLPEISKSSKNMFISKTNTLTIGSKSKKLDNIIRPVLISIFGEVKLIDGSEMSMGPMMLSRLTYHLNRNIKKKDITILENEIKKAIRSKGYILAGNKMENSKFIMTFMKNNRPVLIIEGEINKPIIDVKGVV